MALRFISKLLVHKGNIKLHGLLWFDVFSLYHGVGLKGIDEWGAASRVVEILIGYAVVCIQF